MLREILGMLAGGAKLFRAQCVFCGSSLTLQKEGSVGYVSSSCYEEEVPYKITLCLRCKKTEEIGGEEPPIEF